MPLNIVRNDITKRNVYAIVIAANERLSGGGGVDGAIHRAAGPGLLAECRTLNGCRTGDAKITKGYDLPAKYVIHTVGPVYRDGRHGEEELLISCYRKSLEIAKEKELESIAFPLISAGVYGYPKQEAFDVAVSVIRRFLKDNDMTVYLVVFDPDMLAISKKQFSEIREYISDAVVRRRMEAERYRTPEGNRTEARSTPPTVGGALPQSQVSGLFRKQKKDIQKKKTAAEGIHKAEAEQTEACFLSDESLSDWLKKSDESWQTMLFRCIDERKLTDPEVYRRANIDRKLFSKIRSNADYKASKPTVLALGLALKLPRKELDELLMKAGFALSDSNVFDLIISYFINRGEYDVMKINEALFSFDQSLLGNI